MSKWVPTWSYVAMDYGTVVATYEDVSQRCLLRNNLNGTALRLRFNNLYSEAPLVIRHAAVETVHRVTGQRGQRREVTLDGQAKIVLPADSRPWSDPLPCEITAEEDLIIWLYFEERCAVPSICMTSAARSWQCTQHKGNFFKTEALGYTMKGELAPILAADPSPNQFAVGLSAVSVLTGDEVKLLACFGDSITQMSYFSDQLQERLYARYSGRCALINGGICGNRLQKDAPVLPEFPGGGKQFGMAGRDRFLHDLYDGFVPDAVFIMEGVNDCTHSLVFQEPDVPTAEDIRQALDEVIAMARSHGTRQVYVGTIPPFAGFGEPWREGAEALRCQYNELIRADESADLIVDLDGLISDPDDPHRMRADLHMGDGVHPNWQGGKLMAEAVMDRCFQEL